MLQRLKFNGHSLDLSHCFGKYRNFWVSLKATVCLLLKWMCLNKSSLHYKLKPHSPSVPQKKVGFFFFQLYWSISMWSIALFSMFAKGTDHFIQSQWERLDPLLNHHRKTNDTRLKHYFVHLSTTKYSQENTDCFFGPTGSLLSSMDHMDTDELLIGKLK